MLTSGICPGSSLSSGAPLLFTQIVPVTVVSSSQEGNPDSCTKELRLQIEERLENSGKEFNIVIGHPDDFSFLYGDVLTQKRFQTSLKRTMSLTKTTLIDLGTTLNSSNGVWQEYAQGLALLAGIDNNMEDFFKQTLIPVLKEKESPEHSQCQFKCSLVENRNKCSFEISFVVRANLASKMSEFKFRMPIELRRLVGEELEKYLIGYVRALKRRLRDANTVRERLKATEAENLKLTNELKLTSEENERLKIELDDTVERIDDKERRITELENAAQMAMEERDEDQRQRDEDQRTMELMVEEMDAAENNHRAAEERFRIEIDEIQCELSEANDRLLSIQDEKEYLERDTEKLRQRLKETEAQKMEANRVIQKHLVKENQNGNQRSFDFSKLTELEADIKQKDELITALQKSVADLQAKNDQSTEEVGKLTAELKVKDIELLHITDRLGLNRRLRANSAAIQQRTSPGFGGQLDMGGMEIRQQLLTGSRISPTYRSPLLSLANGAPNVAGMRSGVDTPVRRQTTPTINRLLTQNEFANRGGKT